MAVLAETLSYVFLPLLQVECFLLWTQNMMRNVFNQESGSVLKTEKENQDPHQE